MQPNSTPTRRPRTRTRGWQFSRFWYLVAILCVLASYCLGYWRGWQAGADTDAPPFACVRIDDTTHGPIHDYPVPCPR